MNDFVDIDRERFSPETQSKLWQIFNEVAKKISNQEVSIIALALYGSQNYHLDTEKSDIDTELFIFPSKKDLVFNKTADMGCVETSYGTCHIKDVRSAFDELRKSSPNMLELLATPYMIVNIEYQRQWEKVCESVNYYARLSPSKLVLGLRGLLNRYYDKLQKEENPKYGIGCMRVCGMIDDIIANPTDFNYKDILIQKSVILAKEFNKNPDLSQVYHRYQETLDAIDKFLPLVMGYSSRIYEYLNYDEIHLFERYFTLHF